MTGQEIRRLRERQEWSQEQLATVLNESLDRRYTSGVVSAWETGKRPIPSHVSSFIDALALDAGLPETPPVSGGMPEDTAPDGAPPGGPGARPGAPQVPISQHGIYTRVCTDLWEMVATGVGLTGAALGSDALIDDGRIIDADKEALGKAYGKLAETNETFRRMLVGMTSGGAWLEVSMVTGVTVGKLVSNHHDHTMRRTFGPHDGNSPADTAFAAHTDAA